MSTSAIEARPLGTSSVCSPPSSVAMRSSSVKLVGVPVPEGLKCKIDEPGPVWAKDKIVTAKVLEITKVPETDKLKFLKLDLGKGGEPKTVITGAGNVAPGESGQVVVLAYAGGVLFVIASGAPGFDAVASGFATNGWQIRTNLTAQTNVTWVDSLGSGSPLKLARGQNALWTQGGLQYAPPVR